MVLLVGATASCGPDDSRSAAGWKQVPRPLNQTVTVATAADQERLDEQRAVVRRFLGDDAETLRKFETPAGKLGALRAILEQNVFAAHQTRELQCLGIVLGDVFVEKMGWEWVIVQDEHGRDPGVRVPGTSTILFPMTMISKRMERGEEVDVFGLFNATVAEVEKLNDENR